MSIADRKKWDSKHGERGFFPSAPSPLVTNCRDLFPGGGEALDVAGGAGRHALWLSSLGFRATLLDISPVAIQIAETEAKQRGIELSTTCVDLESDPFPGGPWSVIISCHYLHRPLFSDFSRALADDGVLVFIQPTQSNLQRNASPSARFLLGDGELPQLVADNDLESLRYEEGWFGECHEALMVARKRRT